MRKLFPFLLISLAALMTLSFASHASGKGELAYAHDIKAFSPPALDYKGLCVTKKKKPVKTNPRTASEKLAYAKALLSGTDKIYPNPVKGAQILQALAEQDNYNGRRAKTELARLYLRGDFVTEDKNKAFQLIKEVAPNDPYKAGMYLARLYEHQEDYSNAALYYKRSAAAGNHLAYIALAYLYRDKMPGRVSQEQINNLIATAENKILQKFGAAECDSLNNIASYFLGDTANPENRDVGIEWIEVSAELGDSGALSSLGQFYLYGINADQDVEKGLSYLNRAAENNHGESLYSLGNYWLSKKISLPENRRKGADFLERAAKQGHQEAILKLVKFYRGEFGDTPKLEKAARMMEKAVKLPNVQPELPYLLAEAYLLGDGVPKNPKRAYELFELSAQNNYNDAMVRLGDAYKYGIGVEKQPMKSYRFYRQAANSAKSAITSNRDALIALVENYECGVGKAANPKFYEMWRQRAIHEGAGKVLRPEVMRLLVSEKPEDHKAAFMLLKRRVNDGDREAMVLISKFYNEGIGTEANRALARKWIDRAVEAGKKQDMGYTSLGEFYLDPLMVANVDPQKAEGYFKQAMLIGSKDAGYELGKLYHKGVDQFPPDLNKAKVAYQDAINRGNDNAMRKLAQIYLDEGRDNEAIALLERSAEMRDIDSILELVEYYIDEHKPSDKSRKMLKKAQYWQEKAYNSYPCTDKVKERLKKFDNEIASASNGSVTLVETLEQITKRADVGDTNAMRDLAKRYMLGKGNIKLDPTTGLEWYRKAAEAGDAKAMLELGNIYSVGLVVEQSQEKANDWWKRAAEAGNMKAKQILEVDPTLVRTAPKKKAH